MPLSDAPDLQPILDFAVEAAHLAGALTLGYFNAGTPHELKADLSPVTAADRGGEELLRGRIQKSFPTHGVLGEEFGEIPSRGPARWILDPIDGTFSFICGVPLYSVLIGFEWRGEMLAGVIHMPALGETVYAARGLGCRWNGRPARVSDVSDLSQARISTTTVKQMAKYGREDAYRRVRDAVAADRGWADAYAYALLATGRVDIVLDPIMCVWDSAAPRAVVTEAGGTFTDWAGNSSHTALDAIATNGKLQDAVMSLVRG